MADIGYGKEMIGQKASTTTTGALRAGGRSRHGIFRSRLWRRYSNTLIRLLLFVAVLTIWQIAADKGWIDTFFVSSPDAIGATAWTWVVDGTYLSNTLITLWTASLGFGLGAGGGIVVGCIMGRVQRLADIFGPIMVMMYTLPRLALAPLFVLWFGIGTEFKVGFSSIIVFFLVYYSTYSGVREVPSDLIAAMRVMGASRMELIKKVIFPSALVWVISGLKVSVPYGLVGVIVGEMLVSNEGLGYLIVSNSNQYNTAGVFAAILALLVIGFVIDRSISALSEKALSWKTVGNFQ